MYSSTLDVHAMYVVTLAPCFDGGAAMAWSVEHSAAYLFVDTNMQTQPARKVSVT